MKKLLSTVLLAATAIAAAPIEAIGQQRSPSNHRHHEYLVDAIRSTGIDFKINPRECDSNEKENIYGWYWAAQNELVVCQENRRRGSTRQVNWTEEDYDTLRHEAHHLVQDCMTRDKRDGRLGAVYQNPISVGKQVLGTEDMNQIARVYGKAGADEHTIIMEIEAFSVAAMNDPIEQVSDVRKFCF